jgi:hypothetical protein
VPDAHELLSTYRDLLQGLRRGAGPAGALVRPLEIQADLLDQLLQRQRDVEGQLQEAVQPIGAMVELVRDAPSVLRSQAKAFTAAARSFDQAAEVLTFQADLLERTGAAFDVPSGVLRSVRGRGTPRADEPAGPDAT